MDKRPINPSQVSGLNEDVLPQGSVPPFSQLQEIAGNWRTWKAMNSNHIKGTKDPARPGLLHADGMKVLIIVLALSAISCYLGSNYFYVGFFNDDTVNISLARSLLSGSGYRDIFIPDAPPHRQFPPGFPLMLVPLLALFPHSFIPLKILVIFFSLCSITALYVLFREKMHPSLFPLFLFLCALNTVIVHFSGTVLSDIPHYFFFILFFIALERSMKSWSGSSAVKKTVLILIPLLCFTVCVSIRVFSYIILPSLVLYLVLTRFRNLRFILSLCLISAFSLILCYAVFNRFLTNYINYFILFSRSLPDILSGNLSYYAVNLPAALIGEPAQLNQYVLSPGVLSYISVFLILIIWAVIIHGFIVSVREHLAVLDCMFLTGTLTMLCWPHQDMRYFIPLFPLFYFYIIKSIMKMDGYIFFPAQAEKDQSSEKPSRSRGFLSPGVIFLLVILSVQFFFLCRTTWLSRFSQTYNNTPPRMAYEWIKENSRDDDIFMTVRFALYLYTGRKVVPLDYGDGNNRHIVQSILSGRAGYVFYEQIPYETVRGEGVQSQAVFAEVLKLHDNKFISVFSEKSGVQQVMIYKIKDKARDIFNSAQQYYEQGTRESMKGNLSLGAALFRKCVEEDPFYLEARYNMGITLERQGKKAEACQVYEETIRLAPFYQKPRLSLARLYEEKGEKDKAIKLLEDSGASPLQ